MFLHGPPEGILENEHVLRPGGRNPLDEDGSIHYSAHIQPHPATEYFDAAFEPGGRAALSRTYFARTLRPLPKTAYSPTGSRSPRTFGKSPSTPSRAFEGGLPGPRGAPRRRVERADSL